MRELALYIQLTTGMNLKDWFELGAIVVAVLMFLLASKLNGDKTRDDLLLIRSELSEFRSEFQGVSKEMATRVGKLENDLAAHLGFHRGQSA